MDQLAKYIRGTVEPPFLPIARLCESAGVHMEWLATGEGPMLTAYRAAASQPSRLDPETITSALKLLSWAYELAGAVYDPARDPDLLSETYAYLVEHGGSVTPDNLVDFTKRLAERRAKGVSRDSGKLGAGGGSASPGESDPGKSEDAGR